MIDFSWSGRKETKVFVEDNHTRQKKNSSIIYNGLKHSFTFWNSFEWSWKVISFLKRGNQKKRYFLFLKKFQFFYSVVTVFNEMENAKNSFLWEWKFVTSDERWISFFFSITKKEDNWELRKSGSWSPFFSPVIVIC